MGSAEDEKGRNRDEVLHTVRIDRPFALGRTQVTQALWESIDGSTPSRFEGADRPVENITWIAAAEFCNAASLREKLVPAYRIEGDLVTWDREASGFRLPTEAEWEFAARAGERHRYSGSDDLDAVAWWGGNADGETHPVGCKRPNAWGFHDMSGNVVEWCWDWHEPYPDGTVSDPAGPRTGIARILRGGSFRFGYQILFRVACRASERVTYVRYDQGIRLARTLS